MCEAFRDFHDLSWSANVVENVTPVGDVPEANVGAKRILNDTFHETLQEIDHDQRYLQYSIDDGPGPVAKDSVSGYCGEVRVLPVTVPENEDVTVVIWSSKWESEEGGVEEYCDPIYKALLSDLQLHFG